MNQKIILIMGLPGAGKTTLADALAKKIEAKRLNADQVRKEANDWDFSEEGRKRQAKRMSDFALKLLNDFCLKTNLFFSFSNIAIALIISDNISLLKI